MSVPTHFFKVAVCETSSGELDMEAYVMPNAVIDDATPLQAFMVSPLHKISINRMADWAVPNEVIANCDTSFLTGTSGLDRTRCWAIDVRTRRQAPFAQWPASPKNAQT